MKVLFFSTACRDISKKLKKLLSKIYKYVTMILLTFYGGVAQLARASGSYPEGRGFDSLRRYQLYFNLTKVRFFCC